MLDAKIMIFYEKYSVWWMFMENRDFSKSCLKGNENTFSFWMMKIVVMMMMINLPPALWVIGGSTALFLLPIIPIKYFFPILPSFSSFPLSTSGVFTLPLPPPQGTTRWSRGWPRALVRTPNPSRPLPWRILATPWPDLGPILAYPGPSWRHLGPILDYFGAILTLFRWSLHHVGPTSSQVINSWTNRPPDLRKPDPTENGKQKLPIDIISWIPLGMAINKRHEEKQQAWLSASNTKQSKPNRFAR